MRSKISLKWWLLFVCIVEGILASTVMFFVVVDVKDQGFDIKIFSSADNKSDQIEATPDIFPAVALDPNPVVIPIVVPKKIIPRSVQTVPEPSIIVEGPSRIEIAVLNVDATIEHVGLTSDGAMDVPKGPAEVAWFKLGSLPGDIGSAVMAGHSGWKDGIPAVFDDLYKLQKGDKVSIKNADGQTSVFVVRESRLYSPNADAIEVFNSDDEKAHLNLITCEGVWNSVTKSRSNRLVVFTDKE